MSYTRRSFCEVHVYLQELSYSPFGGLFGRRGIERLLIGLIFLKILIS